MQEKFLAEIHVHLISATDVIYIDYKSKPQIIKKNVKAFMALVKSYSPEGSNLFCWMICRLIEYTTGFSFVLHLFSYHSSPTVDVCL